MYRMIGDNMGFVLSPATQHAGITTEIWVCIDASAMELIALQPSVKRMTKHYKIVRWALPLPSNEKIRSNSSI
jgi:hypothetical protein